MNAAHTVSAIFNDNGLCYRLDDGRTLSAVSAEHGGVTHKTTDRDDTVIVFPDFSAIGCTVLGWDIVHRAAQNVYRSGDGNWTFILA